MQGRAARQREVKRPAMQRRSTACGANAARYVCAAVKDLLRSNFTQGRCPRLHMLLSQNTAFVEHWLDMRCSYGKRFMSDRTLGTI
jgi:hypothetical protein